jgi:hypothetical protein
LKEFRILQNCSICGEGFDSEYKLIKHMSKVHPQPEKSGWIGGGEDSCVCGHYYKHQDG